MLFITQDKTDYKFLLFVIILATIIGGGFLFLVNKQEVPISQLPEIKEPENRELTLEKIENISFQETEDSEDSLDKKIKIKLTTYLGAKGLSANHVFVLGLENGIFPKNSNNIFDDEACQFIVLLTRARRSLRILSVDKRFNKKIKQRADNLSTFVSMIPKEFFEIRDINASNFNKV